MKVVVIGDINADCDGDGDRRVPPDGERLIYIWPPTGGVYQEIAPDVALGALEYALRATGVRSAMERRRDSTHGVRTWCSLDAHAAKGGRTHGRRCGELSRAPMSRTDHVASQRVDGGTRTKLYRYRVRRTSDG